MGAVLPRAAGAGARGDREARGDHALTACALRAGRYEANRFSRTAIGQFAPAAQSTLLSTMRAGAARPLATGGFETGRAFGETADWRRAGRRLPLREPVVDRARHFALRAAGDVDADVATFESELRVVL